MQKRTIFETPDLSVGDFALSKDGAIDLVHRRDQGRGAPLRSARSGRHVRSGSPKGGAISAATPGDGFVVFSKSSLTAPPEIFRVATAGGQEKALTHENARLAREVAFTPPESRTVKGAAGATVQYLADQAAELRCRRGSIRSCS